MPGNYRYEEERSRGQRGMRRGGFGERGRDDDEMEQQAGERYGGPNYGREYGSERYQGGDEGSWGRQGGGREYGRSLGGRENFEGYEDEEDSFGSPYRAGGREGNRYQSGSGQGSRGQRWGGRSYQGNQGPNQGYQGYQGGEGGQGFYQGGQAYNQGGRGYSQGGQGSWQGGTRGGSMQGDGWTAEPDEMRWGRQQGLYGSSEYRGYISSQRSQADFQSHVGKGPKGWQRSDERIREDVSEALARHPEIDASEIEVRVQGGEITLSGSVTDRRAKHLAEEVAEGVFGARDVHNQIKVNASTASRGRGERDVTGTPDREGRTGTEGQEIPSRKAGTGATAGTTTR